MNKFRKSSPELVSLLTGIMEPFECDKRVMFGYPVYFLKGNMFAGLFADKLIFRIPPDRKDELMRRYSKLEVFEPMKGRIMKEYLAVPEAMTEKKKFLKDMIAAAYEYAKTLPARKKH
jgi:TfoX/Sxy family transcriptional regulator of competence genes